MREQSTRLRIDANCLQVAKEVYNIKMGRRKRFTVVDSKQDREESPKKKTGPSCDTNAKKAKKKTMKEVYDGEPEMLDTLIFQEHVEYLWGVIPSTLLKCFEIFDSLWFNFCRLTSDRVNRIKSIVQKNSLLEKSYSLLPICKWNHWKLVVICNKGDNDIPFLMLLDSLHMGEPTRLENELKNFLKIAYEGKEMRAVADELKVIDLYVPKVPQQKGSTECGFMVLYFIFRFILAAPTSFGTNDYPSFLTADWFSREEYEKFREGLQGKRIHIDARSASTSKVVKRGPTMLRTVHGLQSNEHIPVKVNQMGQPLGGGQLLKQFLGTVARMGHKLPINCISWRVMPSSNKDDVWDIIQRKFDVPISLRDFVMKDLDQKWRSWKYDSRTKFFTPY
ncbi:hypothetical protein Taro_037779 [Colocasia esculenta]|uniref:Ubiquitin-like protease family profile domain-containing protein n=1 Tax=Colocasia esculenta TaxID=4460 RepID=A0A843WLR0_COLES|nr:hypothetical protein [Colocasia esculenta]